MAHPAEPLAMAANWTLPRGRLPLAITTTFGRDVMRNAGTWWKAVASFIFFGLTVYGQGQAADGGQAQKWALAYCRNSGGVVELRHAVYGTNNDPSSWLWLAGVQHFCQYTATDGSRIHVSLDTLTTNKPTLAALAYYAQVPWNEQGNGNPASFYCTQIGGAEIGATDLAGGAWVADGGIDQLLETCVFPDNSTIDSWGLLYHSAGIIRGADLTKMLRYANPFTAKKSD
jgi:putative hemolysin